MARRTFVVQETCFYCRKYDQHNFSAILFRTQKVVSVGKERSFSFTMQQIIT